MARIGLLLTGNAFRNSALAFVMGFASNPATWPISIGVTGDANASRVGAETHAVAAIAIKLFAIDFAALGASSPAACARTTVNALCLRALTVFARKARAGRAHARPMVGDVDPGILDKVVLYERPPTR
jgi:hypothetical protein